jgi:hypothetical protein
LKKFRYQKRMLNKIYVKIFSAPKNVIFVCISILALNALPAKIY